MATPKLPSDAEVDSYLYSATNWGRWGDDDELGAVNLITRAKRIEAVKKVTVGRTVSLSRDFPKVPASNNARPAQHYLSWRRRGEVGGSATDYYGISYHGTASTHVDALCHVWGREGMWNGRQPTEVLTADGSEFAGIQVLRDGIVTKGVLIDVPRLRDEPYVTMETPVHGWELKAAAKAEGVAVEPGDALVVYCGREAWSRDHGEWGTPVDSARHPTGSDPRPGLHASCLPVIREWDCSILVWDMMDLQPSGYRVPYTVHGAIHAYGLVLVDNAMLEPLARACHEEDQYEFLLTFAPLVVVGGTGSPINPIAVL